MWGPLRLWRSRDLMEGGGGPESPPNSEWTGYPSGGYIDTASTSLSVIRPTLLSPLLLSPLPPSAGHISITLIYLRCAAL